MNKYKKLKRLLKEKIEKNSTRKKYVKIARIRLSVYNQKIKEIKSQLYLQFELSQNIRNIDIEKVFDKNVVAIFESTLTRTFELNENQLTKEIIIVHTYHFDIIKDLIVNGFYWNEDKYVCFTASAGQIRTKKTVFIKENTLQKHLSSLMCGLTVNKINECGGINVNKYLAYLALCNSATDLWSNFDISKSIVVEDMETEIEDIVDFIDEKKYTIERKRMKVPVTHTDGCGMILPDVSKKSFMVRLPWIKGLLVPFDFKKFIISHNADTKIKDIYGKEWDIVEDNIEVIFTKSQFKMYKYYSSWGMYCDNFKKYKCQAGKCNEEGSFSNSAKINYQMLQTLTDITDEEINQIISVTKTKIENLCSNQESMKKALGVTENNKNKNYLQQAIELYPNILRDSYSQNILKDTKRSLVTEGKSGRIDIFGKYTFICPDLYAFCEFLFQNNNNPSGLLGNGDVFCRIYKDVDKIDCLRSPHLYREHAVRNNVIDDKKSEWFITDGLYTSIHDLISKILQFDVDGDCSLVVADQTIVNIAERNMRDIVPLYYSMAKAPSIEINNNIIYNGLSMAYTGGNIGIYSNNISKIWNSDNIDLNIIKLLTAENNYQIDYAKTLYRPERPEKIHKQILSYTKNKLPHFFIYAKDKDKTKVEKWKSTTVNKIGLKIGNPTLKFNYANVGEFDYRIFDILENTKRDKEIIELYNHLDMKKFFMMNNSSDYNGYRYAYLQIRNEILKVNTDIQYVVSVLVNYLYNEKKSNNKVTLWECFGDIIINNIKHNIATKKYVKCELCGNLTRRSNNKTKYCQKCAKKIEKEQQKKTQAERKRKSRSKK
jgi:arsenate reductase-like glutaredoxin family protein